MLVSHELQRRHEAGDIPATSVASAAMPKTRTSSATSCCRGRLPGGSIASSQLIPQNANNSTDSAPPSRAERSRSAAAGSTALGPRRSRCGGDLLLPARGSREQRVRDVGAGNEQHERHHRHERHERVRMPDTTLSSSGRTVMPMPVLVCGYVRSSRAAMALSSACACATVAPSFSRPKSRSDRPTRSLELARQRQRRPHLGTRLPERRESKSWWHDADDHIWAAIDRDLSSHDRPIPAEAPLP